MADSWKTDGDCSVCRRRKYCSEQCSANQGAMGEAIHAFLMQKMGLGLDGFAQWLLQDPETEEMMSAMVSKQMKEAH